jgi:hypothetical protein
MIGIPPSTARFVNNIINRFDDLYYPTIPVERITEQPSEADQELVRGNYALPKELQAITYDYAPNISNWILSTGILQRGNKDLATNIAIEESAANRLKQLGVVPLPNVTNTRQLMSYVFSTTILNARPGEKNRLLSTMVQNSTREVVTDFLWRVLFKIESILIKCGIGLAIVSTFVIPSAEYIGIIVLGVKFLEAMSLAASPLVAIIGSVVVVVAAAAIAGISFGFLARRLGPNLRRWDASLRQFEIRNQTKLVERQTRQAAEVWVNLLLGPAIPKQLE